MYARCVDINTGIRAPTVPSFRNYRFRPKHTLPRSSRDLSLNLSPTAMLHDAVKVTPREVGGGKGLLVVSSISKGEVVWWEDQVNEPDWVSVPRCRLYIENLPAEARRKFEHYMYKTGVDAYEALPEYDLLPCDEWKLESDDPSMYMNHSCEPTCLFECDRIKVDGVVVMTASRDLHPGDELTFDYATSEDHEQNWRCLCGAPTCRGRVTGDDWRAPEFQQKYQGHCMPHVANLIATDGAVGQFKTWTPPAFLTPTQVAEDRVKYAAAFWTKEECRVYSSFLADRVPLVVKRCASLGKHLVYQGEGDGEINLSPVLAGETVMLLPPNVLRRENQIKGSALAYNASLQVRPYKQAPGALFSLSETPDDLDNFLNHSCDPNCDVVVFPTNYAIALVANRDIFPGEAVTIDYDATEEDLVAQGGSFECACGTSNCRGRVVGWKYRTPIVMGSSNTKNKKERLTAHSSPSSVSDESENETVAVVDVVGVAR